MQVIPVGPLALPVAGLLVLAGLGTAMAIDGWLHRRGRPSTEAVLWLLLLVGVVLARLAFVLRWWPEYASHPLAVLDLRDGGLSPWAGVAGVLLGALWVFWRRWPLREPLAWAVLGGVLVWSFGGLVASRLDSALHTPLPTLVLHDLDGQPRPLQLLRGKPLVVNLWASWCGPCRRELPLVAQAQGVRTQVRLVFADQGESPAEIRAFLVENRLSLDGVLIDPSSRLSQHFGVRGYPATLFFDAQGTLRSLHIGELSPATLAAQLRHIIPDTATTASHLSGVSR